MSRLTHSTSPKVAQPALFIIPHNPALKETIFDNDSWVQLYIHECSYILYLVLLLTYSRTLSHSSCLVTSSWITWSLGLESFLNSWAPSPSLSASKHPANTVNPNPLKRTKNILNDYTISKPLKCLAIARPNPVSQPVMRTALSSTSNCKDDWRTARVEVMEMKTEIHQTEDHIRKLIIYPKHIEEITASNTRW